MTVATRHVERPEDSMSTMCARYPRGILDQRKLCDCAAVRVEDIMCGDIGFIV